MIPVAFAQNGLRSCMPLRSEIRPMDLICWNWEKKHILQLRSTQPNFPQLPKQFLTATGPMVPPSFRRSSTAYVASGTSCQPRRRRRCKCSRYGRSINEWQRPTQRRRFGSKILRKELCCLLFFWGGNKFKINKWGSCVLRGSLELWGVEG